MKDYKIIIEEWNDGYQAKWEYFSENEFEINEPTKHKALKVLEEYILSCYKFQEETVSDLEYLKKYMPFQTDAPYIKRKRQRRPKTDFVINLIDKSVDEYKNFTADIQFGCVIITGDGDNEEDAIKSLTKHINTQYKMEKQSLKIFRDFIKNVPLNENADYIINKRINGSLKDYRDFFDI